MTAIFSIFWLAGSSAWAQGVSDLKYYLHPETLFKLLPICFDDEDNNHDCQTLEDGSYGALNASLVNYFYNYKNSMENKTGALLYDLFFLNLKFF